MDGGVGPAPSTNTTTARTHTEAAYEKEIETQRKMMMMWARSSALPGGVGARESAPPRSALKRKKDFFGRDEAEQ